jgi:L-alanine-DL-glutamate epimerase-like enolase superfamily enzyme
MDGLLHGGTSGKSAIDVACWDLRAKALDVPVSTLLGGVINPSFPLYEAVPMGTPDEMASFIRNRRATGVNRFQLKVGNKPEEDVERVRAAVEAGDRDTVVIADANGGWNLKRSFPEGHRRLRGLSSSCRTVTRQPFTAAATRR